jgi:hypothetical protein
MAATYGRHVPGSLITGGWSGSGVVPRLCVYPAMITGWGTWPPYVAVVSLVR